MSLLTGVLFTTFTIPLEQMVAGRQGLGCQLLCGSILRMLNRENYAYPALPLKEGDTVKTYHQPTVENRTGKSF